MMFSLKLKNILTNYLKEYMFVWILIIVSELASSVFMEPIDNTREIFKKYQTFR